MIISLLTSLSLNVKNKLSFFIGKYFFNVTAFYLTFYFTDPTKNPAWSTSENDLPVSRLPLFVRSLPLVVTKEDSKVCDWYSQRSCHSYFCVPELW